MDVRTEKESSFTELFDTYGELLTPRKKEICELYLNYDLSLGEIGEEKGISRQSVSHFVRTDERIRFEAGRHRAEKGAFRIEIGAEIKREVLEKWRCSLRFPNGSITYFPS